MFAVILLPKFRLQSALRWQTELAERAVAITDEKNVVLECTEAAEQRHAFPGLNAVQALARCPDLILRPRSPAMEQVAQEALLEIAGSLSPEIEDTSPGCATVDLRGARITDWNPWARKVVDRFHALELRAQVGAGPNPDLAFLASRKAAPVLIARSPETFLTQLALSEIDPPPYLQALLKDWGVHTIGQLASLPRGDFADRLGPDADRLWQRASGRVERLLRLARPSEEFAEAFDFEREIEMVEPLHFILRRFLDQLTRRLADCHRVAASMTLSLPLDDGATHERAFVIPSPSADAEVLFRILGTHLEGLQLKGRPTGVRLRIIPVAPEHQQLRLFESPLRDPNRFGETLARLAALVGQGNVGVAEWEDSHRSDAICVVSPRFHELREAPETRASLMIGLPLRRFRPSLPVEVRLAGHLPTEVRSAVVNGRVTDVLGPYRASGHWWEQERWGMEEWDVEIGGHGLFRLRREPGGWLLEGCYDAAIR